MYYKRIIDGYLAEWAAKTDHKPLLLRGARQVGKSTAVRHLGGSFESYVEINFEKMASYKHLFEGDIDIKSLVSRISAVYGTRIVPGQTLLFLDEIQDCPNAIQSLRYFREDLPELHVIAAGSLLEFALDDIPTFGVARIHSMFMYPMTFDEFLEADSESLLLAERRASNPSNPLPEILYGKIINLFRTYLLVGGMPEAVAKWVETHDFLQCQEVQDDIVIGYDADFPKYRKKIDPELIRQTFRSVSVQAGANRFKPTSVPGYKSAEVGRALELLTKAGLIVPVTHTDGHGLPLGSEQDTGCRKYLVLDTGLFLRLQDISLGNMKDNAAFILTSSVSDLVNKGPLAEMVAGLEIMRNMQPNVKHDLYYWLRQAKNSTAEIDYLLSSGKNVVPIEVKANTQGGMKSLWTFMRERKLNFAIRCSLENFGQFSHRETYDDGSGKETVLEQQVSICPLWALSQLS